MATVRLTDRDLDLLACAAEHRLILAAHAQALFDTSRGAATARLRALVAAGVLSQPQTPHPRPGCYQITRPGLAAISSDLRPPHFDVACFDHDVGAAWLYIAARHGTFGPMSEVISERRMRSRDALAADGEAPLAVRLGGLGPGGRERLHYPDLLLCTADGHRVAVELELTGKGSRRRERILAGYGADRRLDAVLYLCDKPSVARSVQASARRLGLARRVHVQSVRLADRPRTQRASVAADRRRALRSRAAPELVR